MVAAIDQLTVRLRRNAAWMLLLLPPAAYALWRFLPDHLRSSMRPHVRGDVSADTSGRAWIKVPYLLAETARMALFGTRLALCWRCPSACFRRAMSHALVAWRARYGVSRSVARGAGSGVGPGARCVRRCRPACGHSGARSAFGRRPWTAVRGIVRERPPGSGGRSRGDRRIDAGDGKLCDVPLAFGPIGVHSLFRLEWNLRQATVVGMIGAGGIGQALFEAQQLFFYQPMVAYLLITWIIVLAVDRASAWTRRRSAGWSWRAEERRHERDHCRHAPDFPGNGGAVAAARRCSRTSAEGGFRRGELRALLPSARAAMIFMPDRVDASFFEKAPRLSIIAAALKGFDNIDVEVCTTRGVW